MAGNGAIGQKKKKETRQEARPEQVMPRGWEIAGRRGTGERHLEGKLRGEGGDSGALPDGMFRGKK